MTSRQQLATSIEVRPGRQDHTHTCFVSAFFFSSAFFASLTWFSLLQTGECAQCQCQCQRESSTFLRHAAGDRGRDDAQPVIARVDHPLDLQDVHMPSSALSCCYCCCSSPSSAPSPGRTFLSARGRPGECGMVQPLQRQEQPAPSSIAEVAQYGHSPSLISPWLPTAIEDVVVGERDREPAQVSESPFLPPACSRRGRGWTRSSSSSFPLFSFQHSIAASHNLDCTAMAPRGQHPRYDEPLVPLQQGTPLLSRTQRTMPATSQPGLIPARPPSHPRDCAPFTASSSSSSLPSWKCKTFAFPAAHPRSIARSARDAAAAEAYTRAEPPPKAAPAGSAPPRMTKEEVAAIRDEMYDRRRNAAKPRPDNSELERAAPLWLTVNRYSPARKGRSTSSSTQGSGNAQSVLDPVTLIFAHANGFSKEVRPPARLPCLGCRARLC